MFCARHLSRRGLCDSFRMLAVSKHHHTLGSKAVTLYLNPCEKTPLKTHASCIHTSRALLIDEENESKERNEDSKQKSEDVIRNEILENALQYVCEHGWSRESLSLGAEESGYASVAEGMFERAGADLVLYFVRRNNASLLKYLEDESIKETKHMKTSTFIRNALEYRLRMIIPYIDVWPEAMAILMQPTLAAVGAKEIMKMVDNIWYHAGDVSSDFNWYTKRGLLIKLYVSMQTVMIKDQSPDFADSWEFLDRRMNDIATFGRFSGQLKNQTQMIADVAFAGFTVLRNITGFGETRR